MSSAECEGANLPRDILLLSAVPLTATTLSYRGDQADRFESAYLRRNPAAMVTTGAAEVAVFGSDALLLAGLAAGERPGVVVARIDEAALAAVNDGLEAAGLSITKAKRDAHGLVVVAVEAGRRVEQLKVELWAFAPRSMDIRTRLPMDRLDSSPQVTSTWRTAPFAPQRAALDAPKILILQRPGPYSEADLREFLAGILALEWLPVMEVDDHPLMTRVGGDAVAEFYWLMARGSVGVQTSTHKLAAAFAPYNGEVKVFPNAVFDLPSLSPRPGAKVFYGAVLRGAFAVDVARSLGPAIRRCPDIEFVVIGDRDVFDALPTDRKQLVGVVGYEAYLEMLGQCGIALSPLAGAPFEDTKSDAKYLDAASAGALMIASPTVYGEVVEHGVNGLIAEGIDDWAACLIRALEAPAAREAMIARAWEDVRDRRMFAHQVGDREAWYRSLWARRGELLAQLYGRWPGLEDQVHERRRAMLA